MKDSRGTSKRFSASPEGFSSGLIATLMSFSSNSNGSVAISKVPVLLQTTLVVLQKVLVLVWEPVLLQQTMSVSVQRVLLLLKRS